MIEKRKAKVVFYCKTNPVQILMGRRRSGGEEFWWIPGGSIEGDEDAFQALTRELGEEMELSAELKEVILNSAFTKNCLSYESGKTSYNIYFVETPEKILNESIIPKEEFDRLQWFPITGLPEKLSREFEKIKDRVNEL